MSRQQDHRVDCPPKGGPRKTAAWTAWRCASLIAGCLLWLCAGVAMAQDHPRIDPGTPPPGPAGGPQEGWAFYDVPGLPAGSVLGDVWVAPNGDVYVWANVPPRVVANTVEDPVEGERLPNPPGRTSQNWSGVLYRFDGIQWTAMLRTPGEKGVALLGDGLTDLFATTTSQQGEARLYHLNGQNWVREEMPGYYLGQLHTLAGTANDLYFKVDRVILHHNGERFWPVFELPFDESAERGLVNLGADGLFVMSGDCHFLFHNGTWTCVEAGFDFGHVEDAWGMRDASGRLQMYAIGDDGDNSGVKVWRFDEFDANTHDGIWIPSLLDPMSGHLPGIGSGYHLWGGAGNDVYATGVVMGEGHMFRFNGTAWIHLNSPQPLGTVHGVWGGHDGTVWFSTEAGQLVRYQRANSPPEVAYATPSVARLWPADRLFTAVDILGVTDPEGDPFTLRIDRVLSDEDPNTPNVVGACPDAKVVGSRVMLRNEHAPNGDGRTYVIEFTATDQLGLSNPGRITVCAPHYETTPCDVDPALFDALGGPCAVPGQERIPMEADDRHGALRVKYELAAAAPVHLGLYDVAGRLRATLESGERTAGVHEVAWDLRGMDPGVYFVRLNASGPAVTRRVVVLR